MIKTSRKLLISMGNIIKVISRNKIILIQSEGSYSIIFLQNEKKPVVICKSLKKLEELLVEDGFCRCHKSTLVNTEYIEEIKLGKDQAILMKNGTIIKMSQRGRKKILKLLREV